MSSDPTSEFEPAIGRLERQAEELIQEDTNLLTVVCELEFDEIEVYEDGADGWLAKYDYEPMVRAFYCKELEGFNITELYDYLAEGERACTLGFDPEKFANEESAPNRTTLGRAWRDRFPEPLKQFIQASTERFLAYAHDIGNPLGMRALAPEDKSDVSTRTEQRHIHDKATEITQALCDFVFPMVDLGRPDEGTRYDDTAFLELQSFLGLTGTAANQGSRMFDDETTRETGGPDGDTHRQYITQLTFDHIVGTINGVIGRMMDAAKRYHSFDRHVDVAIDITYVAYYGDRDEFKLVKGAPDNKSYEWCYKIGTIAIVGEETKFTLGMLPLRGYMPREVIVDYLVELASEHISIGTVYADAGFDSIGVMYALEEANVSYLIRKSDDERVKRFVKEMDHDVGVKQSHEMESTVVTAGETVTVTPTLVGVPSSYDEEKTVTFVTNLEVSDGTRRLRRHTRQLMEWYSDRWGVENSYKSIKDFLAWTTSKSTALRVFYFGFAIILYDMWLLVDLLIQVNLDLDRRLKPRVPARTFLNIARKEVPFT